MLPSIGGIFVGKPASMTSLLMILLEELVMVLGGFAVIGSVDFGLKLVVVFYPTLVYATYAGA